MVADLNGPEAAMRRVVLLYTALLGVSLGQARADALPDPASQSAIQSVISQQLDAFRKEDGVAAEAFAAPTIREKFPDPSGFMSMVKQSYGALVRPKTTAFGPIEQTPLGLVQKLTVVDTNGQVWTAAYTMTQVDGQWRISGCFMLKSEAVDT